MQNPNWQGASPEITRTAWPGGQGGAAGPGMEMPHTATGAATQTPNPNWQASPGMSQNFQAGGQTGAVLPRVDVLETDSEFIYVFEVPGPDPDQINVEVSAREIALTGPESTAYRATRYHSLERPHGRYMRLLRTPPNVNTNDATARYRHGELELHLPKRP